MKKFVRECAGKKAVVDFHINENTITETSRPVDYSFFRYKALHPVGCEQARATRLGEPPERGKQEKKFLTKGIWLNNNKLTNITNMDTLVSSVIENPEKLSWVDFSFNYINRIDDVILKFCNLSIIYFHGNRIKDIEEVAKLNKLKKLRNITFHGNPIASMNDYRHIIITYLPGIVHLDNQPVLRSERHQPLHPDSIKYMKSVERQGDVPCLQPDEGKNIREKSNEEEKMKDKGGLGDSMEYSKMQDDSSKKPTAITTEKNENANVIEGSGRKGLCRCYFKGKRLKH